MKNIAIAFIACAICATTILFAQEIENLVPNPDFELRENPPNFRWSFQHYWISDECTQDKGYQGKNSLRCKLLPKASSNMFHAQVSMFNTFSKPGKYIFAVNYKADKIIFSVRIMRTYEGQNKKAVYQIIPIYASDLPKPGEWGRLMAEIDILEGINKANLHLTMKSTEEATIWLDSPMLTIKEEE